MIEDLPKTVLLHDLLHCAAEQGKEEEDGHDVDYQVIVFQVMILWANTEEKEQEKDQNFGKIRKIRTKSKGRTKE